MGYEIQNLKADLLKHEKLPEDTFGDFFIEAMKFHVEMSMESTIKALAEKPKLFQKYIGSDLVNSRLNIFDPNQSYWIR
jgi:hypothetical protein